MPGAKAQGEPCVNFDTYKKVQSAAKAVHGNLQDWIAPDSTERSIAEKAIELMSEQGITDTWYHDVPAFVLLGSRSCLSISGKDYCPSDERVGETNLVTVDLSPMLGVVWGDCARSYYVEHGICTLSPQSKDFQEGVRIESELHRAMKEFVTPDTQFSELYHYGNHLIKSRGYENLDFLGNLGHSIEIDTSERRFIDKYCNETLGSVKFFTFEPHVRKVGGAWGFKHEDIYYFNDLGRAVEL